MIHREPEWDDYSRAEAIGLVLDERRTCSKCGLIDCYEALDATTHIGWDDGRKYTVKQFRCLGCGALELVQRDTDKKHGEVEKVPGRYHPGDGLRMTVEPMCEGG